MEEVKRIPKLRFPNFEGAWTKYNLGDIAEFSKGKGISKSDIDEFGEFECIRYGELYTTYNEIIETVVSKTNVEIGSLVLSKKNDIIIPASGETQLDIATASCVLKDDVALSGDLNIIRTEQNGVFTAFYLNSKKKFEIASLAQGNSVVHLYSRQLKTLNLNLPSVPEQTKIANFLTAVDAKIANLSEEKSLLENYKKGVMQKIFSQELRFKQDDGSNFPEWETKQLDEVALITMGQSPSSTSYNVDGIGKYLIQGNADIKNRKTEPRVWTNEPTKECKVGDLILTVRAPVGAVALSGHDACIGRGVCSIRNKANSNQGFIYQFLKFYETKWIRIEQGSTFTAVSGKDIKSLKLNIPHSSEQTKIANFLTSIDEKISTATEAIENAQTFKKGLLQQLFV